MLESIALGAVATGIAQSAVSSGLADAGMGGAKVGISKVHDVLERRNHADQLEDVWTEFTRALEDTLEEELRAEYLADIEKNRETISEELDDVENLFENETAAIDSVTDAICTAIEDDVHRDDMVRRQIEAAVATAYDRSIAVFKERVADTELETTLEAEAGIDVSSTVDVLEGRLTEIQEQLERRQHASLQNAGFERLDHLHFQRKEAKDPETAWRKGFRPSEVKAGHSLRRERPADGDNDDRRRLTTELREKLENGVDVVLLGDSGSGKSTTCKAVACEWYDDDDTGPVLYRESTETSSFDSRGTLDRVVRPADGPLLVVVEDAIDGDPSELYRAIENYEGSEAVAFLLDARRDDWQADDVGKTNPRLQRVREGLTQVEMPDIDEREARRAVEHYQEKTGTDLARTGAEIHREVRQADMGGALVMAYRLTGPQLEGTNEYGKTALHADVRATIQEIEAASGGDRVTERVAMMVNVLNAADFEIEKAYVHALGSEPDEYLQIQQAFEDLKGIMLGDGDDLRAPHRLWSVLYIDLVMSPDEPTISQDEYTTRIYFEDCIEALFRLTDDQDAREYLHGRFRGWPEPLERIREDPSAKARQFVRGITSIGRTHPSLGVLFGTPETWEADLPDTCSVNDELEWHEARGLVHLRRGDFESARLEFERAEAVVEKTPPGHVDNYQKWYSEWRSRLSSKLGRTVRRRGDLDTSEEHLEQSLAINYRFGRQRNVAGDLVSLGHIARERGEYDLAERYFNDSITFCERGRVLTSEVSSATKAILEGADHPVSTEGSGGDTTGRTPGERVDGLEDDVIGAVAWGRPVDDDAAEDGDPAEEDDRGIEAATDGSTTSGAVTMGEDVSAEEGRDGGGDPAADGTGDSPVSFGQQPTNSGSKDHPDAESHGFGGPRADHDDTSQSTPVEFGGPVDDPKMTEETASEADDGGLGADAGSGKSETDTSRSEPSTVRMGDTVDDSTKIAYKHAFAISLNSLGQLEIDRGNLEEAKENHERALRIDREVTDRHGQAVSLNGLGQIARRRGNLERAATHHQRALRLEIEDGNDAGRAISCNYLGHVAKDRSRLEEAEEYYEKSKDLHEAVDNRSGEASSCKNLGDVSRLRGDLERAEEQYRGALERGEDDDIKNQAASHRGLGQVALERGQLDEANRHLQESLDLYRTERHRPGIAHTLRYLGHLALERGEPSHAADRFERSLEIADDLGHHNGQVGCFVGLASVAAETGRWDQLEKYVHGIVDRHEGLTDVDDLLDRLQRAIETAQSAGSRDRACRLCTAAIELADQIGEGQTMAQFQSRAEELSCRERSVEL